MSKKDSHLQTWMTAKGLTDSAVAKKTRRSRVQISRIRRGKSGAKKATAIRLEAVTGIDWHHFIQPNVSLPKKAS